MGGVTNCGWVAVSKVVWARIIVGMKLTIEALKMIAQAMTGWMTRLWSGWRDVGVIN